MCKITRQNIHIVHDEGSVLTELNSFEFSGRKNYLCLRTYFHLTFPR